MHIEKFVSKFKNHPVLFIGTGFSLRYLENSYNWNDLLKKIAFELKGNEEYFLDLKSNYISDGKCSYSEVARELEEEFNKCLKQDRNGKFKNINDYFYAEMATGLSLSRFKIYICELLKVIRLLSSKEEEIIALKKVRKNIGSIITTNYDKLIEKIFEFDPLIGNDILLSNPYGALYKIHGCIEYPEKIIITENDYEKFEQKYELIRAQLLSLFIHNPIIFIGYNIGDENIKRILKTIFTYVETNSEQAQKIRSNFLLVEYEKDSESKEVAEHDIDMEGFSTIRINKIKTDNFLSIYNALSILQLPVSAMDVRKVQNIVKEIYTGGSIRVSITEDLDQLDNKDKVLVIGSSKTIKYTYQTSSEMMINYFKIIDESNFQLLELIDQLTIQPQQFFPIYGFSKINTSISSISKLKEQQEDKLKNIMKGIAENCKTEHTTVDEIYSDENIPQSYKINAILYSTLESKIDLTVIEKFLRNYGDKKSTDYRRLLCAYDYVKYKNS